jgi:hypothetical protein
LFLGVPLRGIAIGLVSLVVASGCSRDSLAPPGPSGLVEGIQVADSQSALDTGTLPTQFNFAHLRSLFVRVNLAGIPRTSQLALTLSDPKGTAVYETAAVYSSDSQLTQMFQAKPVRGGYALDYTIPVSGHVITRHLVAGTWVLEARIDGTRTFSKSLDVSTTF